MNGAMNGERSTITLVVGLVGLFTIITLLASAWLAFNGKTVPDGFYTLAGTGLGALASMLVRTSSTQDQPTEVVSVPGQPVETVEVAAALPDPADPNGV